MTSRTRSRRAAWRRIRNGDGRDEHGYVIVLVAGSMTVLLLMAALSVDVGAWFARGSQIQRAADAAALAGVPYMPDLAAATTVAQATAAKNGFTGGQNSVNIAVAGIPQNPHQLKVTITDGNVKRYFSGIIFSGKTIAKTAIAEYDPAVPMGSPKNTFGTGDLLGSPYTENIWAAVSGACSGRENGDLRLAEDDRNKTSPNGTGTWTCSGQSPNPTYDANGYYYAIEIPAGAAGSALKVDLYDPAYDCGKPDHELSNGSCGSTITTTYRLLAPDSTAFDITDNPLLTSRTFNDDDDTYKDAWNGFWSGTAQYGTYYLQVYTKANETSSFGTNGFSIRAYTGGAFASCTTISGQSGYSATCPQVHAVDNMSIFADQDSSTAIFYLASLDPAYGGKTMEIDLFDPGEGAKTIQVLDPNGNPVSFSWSTPCGNGIASASGGCSGSGTTLDVSGDNETPPYSYVGSGGRFNDRMVSIQVALPSNYTQQYGTKTWWQIKYTTDGGSVSDRTTWGVIVNANPIHLST